MKTRLLHRIAVGLLTVSCLGVSAVGDDAWSNAEKLNPGITGNSDYLAAKKAAEAGDHEKSYEILSDLVFNKPGDPAVNYALGREAFYTKRYAQASVAFEQALASRPDYAFIHIELARAHSAAGLYALAHNQLELALDADPPPEMRDRIDALRKNMRAAATGWKTGGQIRLSAFYNDNVNVGPSSGSIDIAPLSFGSTPITSLSISESSKPQDSAGLLWAVNGNAVYDIGKPGNCFAFGAVQYFGTRLDEDSVEEYELDFIRFKAGLRNRHKRGSRSISIKAGNIQRDGSTLAESVGAVPRYSIVSKRGNIWTAELDAEYREYPDHENLDGTYLKLREIVSFSDKGLISGFKLGAGIIAQDVRNSSYSSLGADANTYFEIGMPAKSVLYCSTEISYAKYNKKELLAPETRTDLLSQVVLGIKKDFNRAFGADLNYRYNSNVCSFDLYEYDRNIVEFTVYYLF